MQGGRAVWLVAVVVAVVGHLPDQLRVRVVAVLPPAAHHLVPVRRGTLLGVPLLLLVAPLVLVLARRVASLVRRAAVL
uniref:Uncharacterized protein n=1 Tax=Ixodes ricinus TaxID=34613 RepID=A0A6B0U3J8_IXORI